jgi:TRAP-type C4-dicarboxylate transport system substrate-binding protein
MTRTTLQSWLVASAIVLTASLASAETIRWDLANEYQSNSLPAQADHAFKELVEAKTDGQIEVTLQHGGALGYKSVDQFDAVADGALPLANSYTGVFSGIHPIFVLSNMPFLAPSFEKTRALVDAARPYFEEVFEENNQKLLYVAPWTPTGLWAKKAVTAVEDLENMRLRAYDPTGVRVFSQVGAAPIQLSWADVVPQLTTGGIDAVLTSDEGGTNAKFWEHLSHFNVLNFSLGFSMGHMNRDVFDDLSPELQDEVMAAAREAEDIAWEKAQGRVAGNFETMREHGMEIVEPTPELIGTLQEAAEPVLEEWKKDMGPEGQEILDAYREKVGS